MQIKGSFGPLTKIIVNTMAKKGFKLSTYIKFERILDFLDSKHAGFRCGSLFLVQKDITMELFFSIIMNTILLYSMVFFIFYIPT